MSVTQSPTDDLFAPKPERVLVTEGHTVRRWDVLDVLNERMTCLNGIEVGDFVDELFGHEIEMSFGELLEWAYAVSVKIS